MPESEKLKQQATHIQRLERRERRRKIRIDDEVVSPVDVKMLGCTLNDDAIKKIRATRKLAYVREYKRLEREALLPSDRLCACGRIVLASRKWVVIPAYETKEARARARVREFETGEPMRKDTVCCITCYRKAKKCGSLQEAVS